MSHFPDIHSVLEDVFDWSETVFVLETFDGDQYDALCTKKCRYVIHECVHDNLYSVGTYISPAICLCEHD